MPSQPYLIYSDSLEQPAADEEQTFAELSQVMQHITRTMAEHYRHAYRPVHAKSHGVVKARLEVLPDLPPAAAQGLFATPGTYEAILRFSTNPGDLLADNVSSPRGLATKVLGVEGEMLPSNAGQSSQDFVCVNADVFGAPGPKEFLKQLKGLDKTLELPEGLKHAVSASARIANEALRAVHVHVAALDQIGHPATHPLGETYTTVAPLRHGNYLAKFAFEPGGERTKAVKDEHIDLGKGYNPLRDCIRDFFADGPGVWDVKVQLALADPDKFPIEKADVRWPVEESPWVTVGRLTANQQESYSDARQVYVDERVNFSPWHGLAAHRPLGGVMRSRLRAYEEAQKYRALRNAREVAAPKSLAEMPD